MSSLKVFLFILLALIRPSLSFAKKFLPLNEQIIACEKLYKKDSSNLQRLTELVKTYNLNSNYSRSERLLIEFKRKYSSKKPYVKGDLLLLFALTHKFANNNELAKLNFLQAEDYFLKHKKYEAYINCGIEMIEFDRRVSRHAEGEKKYRKFLNAYKKYKINNPKILNGLYNRFAAILNETARGRISIIYSKKAIVEAKKINDIEAIAISMNELGFSYKNVLNHEESIKSYEASEKLFFKLGYYRDYMHTFMNRIEVMDHNKMLTSDEEIKIGNYAIKLIDSLKIDYSKFRPFLLLRQAYINKGDFEQALYQQYKMEEERFREVNNSNQAAIFNIQEKFQNDKLTKENEKIVQKAIIRQEQLKSTRLQLTIIVLALVILLLALFGLYYLWNKLRKANKLLIKRNEQKTLLVQEIHHRVKNNLQFVRSILEMQRSANSGNSKTDLEDVSRRIEAMSLVHEMLYIEDEKMTVSVKGYLTRLMDLSNNFYLKNESYHVNLDIEDIEMTVDKVVSLGIICTELLTNSVKHAFPTAEAPVFSIKLKVVEGQIKLTVADNGQEKSTKRATNSQSLGMRLIDIFSRQLGGNSSIIRENGYTFLLEFKI